MEQDDIESLMTRNSSHLQTELVTNDINEFTAASQE